MMEKNDEEEIGIYEIQKPGDLLDPLIRAARILEGDGGRKGGVSELARRLTMSRSNVYPILRRAGDENADILLSTVLRFAGALGYRIWFSEPPEKKTRASGLDPRRP
jgi:DNA-binding phage protein